MNAALFIDGVEISPGAGKGLRAEEFGRAFEGGTRADGDLFAGYAGSLCADIERRKK